MKEVVKKLSRGQLVRIKKKGLGNWLYDPHDFSLEGRVEIEHIDDIGLRIVYIDISLPRGDYKNGYVKVADYKNGEISIEKNILDIEIVQDSKVKLLKRTDGEVIDYRFIPNVS